MGITRGSQNQWSLPYPGYEPPDTEEIDSARWTMPGSENQIFNKLFQRIRIRTVESGSFDEEKLVILCPT
jgi:hypothetical protein